MYQYPKAILIERLLAELIQERDSSTTLKYCDIDSTYMNDFLTLTDAKVEKEFRDSKDPVLRRKWRALEKCSFAEATVDNQNSYKIDIRVDLAGTKMREEDIPFYGDDADKPDVHQAKGAYEQTFYFTILDQNNNDH